MNGKARRAIGKTATYVTLVIIILVLNLPFLSMLGTALKPSKDAMTVELFPLIRLLRTLLISLPIRIFQDICLTALSSRS